MIDIQKGSHVVSFPVKVASMMGQYSHVYNIVLQADTDNGMLAGRGDYVSFDQYEQDAPSASFAGRINEQAANGNWLVEVTALPSDEEVLVIYNSAISPYAERDLQDEALFFNKAGEVAQGAVLCIVDVIELSENAFIGTIAAGATVSFDSSTNKYEVSTISG